MRILADCVSTLLLSTALLFGSASLFSWLCYTGRAGAASFPPLPFFPLPILVFMLLGFLFRLLVSAAGQRWAGDNSGGNCEGRARRGARRGGGRGHGDVTPIAFLHGPVRREGARRRVSAGGALVHGQVLGATALRGAGRVGVGGRAGLLVRRCRRVGRDGEMGGRARGDVGG